MPNLNKTNILALHPIKPKNSILLALKSTTLIGICLSSSVFANVAVVEDELLSEQFTSPDVIPVTVFDQINHLAQQPQSLQQSEQQYIASVLYDQLKLQQIETILLTNHQQQKKMLNLRSNFHDQPQFPQQQVTPVELIYGPQLVNMRLERDDKVVIYIKTETR
ncbi:hypothetical protein EC844_13118 [Acinetobacter calcoaceticus]|uniref:Uncharacterized protein n=1 Tax=Acinetobacter calcoaceticus TaxID=471 RepID=A0A4R1XCP2_ACICA|nr:hypothetical protein EC844_13118 [Acinetobacter calcoaceticus]